MVEDSGISKGKREIEMNANLDIRPELKVELDRLATQTHRSESDIVNEALENHLAHTRTPSVAEVIAKTKATRHKSTLEGIDLRDAIGDGRD